ncbi:MAG: protein kinase [Polyangiaceae bacterium]|jgi:serine/threonine protein kinase|nr:protein kinase [Polyangiaceae bacterium]MBK8938414.1 protein kinase [Polyangiaceae bacterium]
MSRAVSSPPWRALRPEPSPPRVGASESEEAPVSDLRVGKVELGGFRLRGVIGQGAFGTAYLADQLGTDRHAVVKIAHPHLMDGEVGRIVRKRFEAEIRAVSRVHHPALVLLYTAGMSSDGLPALATEFVPGRNLGVLLREGMSRLAIQACFTQVAQGIAALHQGGIVHRDLSPENIIVSDGPDGVVAKIIDFGVAKLEERGPTGPNPIGTPRYIAPEQIRGAAEPASDLYALGALLFFALTGEEYLHDVSGPVDVLLRASALQMAHSPRALNPAISTQEDHLVCALLSPRAEERPSAAEFLARWARIGATLSETRRALLVEEEPEMASIVLEHLKREGYSVVSSADPRRAAQAYDGQYALIVVSSRLRACDPVLLVRQLEAALPRQEIWVIGKSFSLAWNAIARARCLVVPEDLAPATTSSRPTSSGRSSAAPVPAELSPQAEDFIGGGTEIVTVLIEASRAGDQGSVAAAGDQLAKLAASVGASQVTSLSRTLVALVRANEIETTGPFVEEVQSAFRDAVRKLLTAEI